MKRKIIAVTGKIGSGKSVVGRYLAEKGYTVVDCDIIAKNVAKMPDVLAEVQKLLGEQSVTQGELNRPFIREKVFANAELLEKYNAVFREKVKQELTAICAKNNVVFVEIPPVKGFVFDFDCVIYVKTPLQTALQRAVKRDGVSTENVQSIWGSQSEITTADFVLENDGSLQQLYLKVDEIVSHLGI